MENESYYNFTNSVTREVIKITKSYYILP